MEILIMVFIKSRFQTNRVRGLSSNDKKYLEHLAHDFANRALSIRGPHLDAVTHPALLARKCRFALSDKNPYGISMIEQRLSYFVKTMELCNAEWEILQLLCVIHFEKEIKPVSGVFDLINPISVRKFPEVFMSRAGQFSAALKSINLPEFVAIDRRDHSLKLGAEIRRYLLGEYGTDTWLMLVKSCFQNTNDQVEANGGGEEHENILRLLRDDIGSQVYLGPRSNQAVYACQLAQDSNRTLYELKNVAGRSDLQVALTIVSAAKLLQSSVRSVLLVRHMERFFDTESELGRNVAEKAIHELWSLRTFMTTNVIWSSEKEFSTVTPRYFFDDPSHAQISDCYECIKNETRIAFIKIENHGLSDKYLWQLATCFYDFDWYLIKMAVHHAAKMFAIRNVAGLDLYCQIASEVDHALNRRA
jgi:hypothetical protein